jgi:hypothetical protein
MKKHILTVAITLGLAVPALTAHGATARGSALGAGGWQVADRVSGLGDAPYIWAVTAAGTGSEWAFGAYANKNGDFALERTGSTWTAMPLPITIGPVVARASSASDVWVFGDFGAARWNGTTWSAIPMSGASDAIVFGPADVWAFSRDGGISRYNGRSWSELPGSSSLVSGNALSPTSIWAGGGTVIAHWNGRSWTRTSVAKLIPSWAPVSVVYAASADDVYAIANPTVDNAPAYLLHWNGRAWSNAATIPVGVLDPGEVTGDGSGGIWVDSLGAGIMHYSDGRLTTARLPISGIDIKGLSLIPGTADVLAGGLVIHKNATTLAAVLEYTP